MTISYSINRKLRNNDPPTAEEAVTVRKALTGSLDKLQTLEERITSLQSQLDGLSLQKQHLSDFVEGHTMLLSPIRRLLPEILQEVFYQCLPTTHNVVMSVDAPPLLLGRVCSQWRQIAYSTPQLWNSIHIIATPPTRQSDEARRHAISAWLARSGILPLSISMCATGFGATRRPRTPINNRVQPYFELLTPYMHRWKSIHLTIHYFDWTDFFKTFGASDLPLLETLHLEGDRQRRRDHDSLDIATPSRKGGVLQAPRLCVLSLPSHFPRLLEMSIRWEALKGLDLSSRGLAPEDINKALALCPNLEFCSISVVTPDYHSLIEQPHQITEVVLPKLRTLEVKGRSTRNENTFQLFEKLSAPALRHLSYERSVYMWPHSPTPGDYEPDRHSSSFSFFLRKLLYPLEELDLWISSEHVLRDILLLVPEVKRLSLRGTGVPRSSDSWGASTSLLDDHILGLLTPKSAGERVDTPSSPSVTDDEGEDGDHDDDDDDGVFPTPPPYLCPKLEVFHCAAALFSNRKISRFLRARSVDHQKHNVAHLKRVGFSFHSRFPSPLSPLTNVGGDGVKDEEERFGDEIKALGKETGVLVDFQYPSIQSLPQMQAYDSFSPWSGSSTTSPLDIGKFFYSGFWEGRSL